jgi:hypothetical protein
MTKYKDMENLLKNRKPFTGNSVTATKTEAEYKVFSYNTLIYAEGFGKVYFDDSYYSKTTSKLQNIIRRVFKEELK